MLISPMWDNEVQRIGVYRCSKLASNLRGYGDLCTVLAFFILIGSLYFSYSGWWALFVWIFGRLLYVLSERLLLKHHFEYDYDNRRASWIDQKGQRCILTPEDLTH